MHGFWGRVTDSASKEATTWASSTWTRAWWATDTHPGLQDPLSLLTSNLLLQTGDFPVHFISAYMSCAQIHLRGRTPDGSATKGVAKGGEGRWLSHLHGLAFQAGGRRELKWDLVPLVCSLEPKHVYLRKYRERDGNGYKVSLPFKIENTGALQITVILVSAAYSTAESWCCQVSLFLSLHPSSLSPSLCLYLSVFYISSIYLVSFAYMCIYNYEYKFRNHSFKINTSDMLLR